MFTVRVRNCQSILDASIKVEGFTVVTGPNNSGKTALQRAVRAPFLNGSVGALVRHGENALSVDFTFDNDRTLSFTKGNGVKPTYIIDGGKPLHPGREVPTELAEFGVVPVIVGRDKLWPQIATQFSTGQFSGPIFLLDRPGSVLAEVVADVERVGRLSKAMKLCDSDRRKVSGKLATRVEDKAAASLALARFDGLDTVLSAADGVEALVGDADTQRVEMVELAALEARHTAEQSRVAALDGVAEVSIPSTAMLDEASQAGQESLAFAALESQWLSARQEVDNLVGITEVSIPDSQASEEAVALEAEVQTLRSLESHLYEAQEGYDRWSAAVVVSEGVVFDQDPWDKYEKVLAAFVVVDDLQGTRNGAHLREGAWLPHRKPLQVQAGPARHA